MPDDHIFLRDEEGLTENEMHGDRKYWETDDQDPNEIFCSLCGEGCDNWTEVKKHIFCNHYDMVRDSAKFQLDDLMNRREY